MRLVCALLVALAHPLVAQQTYADTLRAYVSCYAKEMNLVPLWRIELGFVAPDPERDWYAGTQADPDYRQASMEIDTAATRSMGDRELRELVVHELAHVWIWELAAIAEKYEPERGLAVEEQAMTFIERWRVWQKVCRR